MNPAETAKDWAGRSKQFYTDVISEMRKVSWPSRQEVMSTTIVVIVAVFFFGLYLGLVDIILGKGVGQLFAHFRGPGG
jgi:preprotein translocase subunit SecE